eukprot:SAG31_NODE_1851_length_7077_cov_2.680854_6_plen_151_part_00
MIGLKEMVSRGEADQAVTKRVSLHYGGEVVLGAGPAEVRATVGRWPVRYNQHTIDALQLLLRPFDGRRQLMGASEYEVVSPLLYCGSPQGKRIFELPAPALRSDPDELHDEAAKKMGTTEDVESWVRSNFRTLPLRCCGNAFCARSIWIQ